MTSIIKEVSISEERYIEIKNIAYEYYDKFISLDRRSRKSFLESLPDMGSKFENDILENTLLFPDTPQLLVDSNGTLQNVLGKMAKNEDYITTHNIDSKVVEYSLLNTRQLIKAGKLKVMDELSYPDRSISDRQYKNLKNDAIKFSKAFCDLSLQQKLSIIAKACENPCYQHKIQISTLLIPNDLVLMEQLKQSSVEDVANYYMVPESLIEFKKEEFDKQDTLDLIKEGQIETTKSNRLWYKDFLDDSMVFKLWNQSVYKQFEKNDIQKANIVLSGMFAEDTKKLTK